MRPRRSIAGNPVLIGAATILVVVVAVFLAYNANQGLPFVPTYELKAEVPSAANLVVGNDIRIGGARVGSIADIDVHRRDDGTNVAVLDLKLDDDVRPLPRDSTLIVRPRSTLGLKYLEITRGRARQGYDDGDTIPTSASRPHQVELDEVVNMFDDDTRASAQRNLRGFGDAFAGRGASLNQAIGAFRPLLRDIVPVARNLSAPDTNLSGFFEELGDAAGTVAPAAETQAELFGNLDATFTALNEVARPFIQDSITEGRPALDAGIRDFPQIRPFLANTQGLMRELRPGIRELRGSAPVLADAVEAGAEALPRAPGLNRRLTALLRTLQSFAKDPLVPQGLRRTTDTLKSLEPTLRFLAPAQTTCNYISLFFRNIASLLSEGDASGTWQRFIIIAAPIGPNSEGFPSSAPANGPAPVNHLHSNPYPNTAAPGQPKECEAGNESYLTGQTITGNVAGTQSATTEETEP